MQIFIVGGTGFIGYHAVLAFLEGNHHVTVLALPPLPAPDLLPPEVNIILADLNALSDQELLELLDGMDAVIFAAGMDDRSIPPSPAYPHFFQANVKPTVRLVQLAGKAGVKSGVVLSSYFSYFDRMWPEKNLGQKHPYIRSRLEQAAQSFEAAVPGFQLAFLELPFIFGIMPGRSPMWTPLIRYLHSNWPLFCIEGGTNVISVTAVAQAILGAVETGAHGRFPVGDENLPWEELFSRLMERDKPRRKFIYLPQSLIKIALKLVGLTHRLQGKEGGLDPTYLHDLLANKLYFDPKPTQDILGYKGGGLDQALADTIRACRPSID